YYRNAGDLNIDVARKDHIQRNREAGTASFFINLGEMDGFDKGSLAKYLSSVSGIPVAKFGRINLKKVYSFIDTEPELLDNIIQSFKNEIYNERKVRVDASDDSKQGIKSKDNKKDSFRNKKGKKHFDNKTFDKKAKYKKKEYRRK
ncbi:MAG: DbpA RNA binding domain-containing protein, partial [Bacteroidales bacterium]|nr:DbpA RNA binding domain-containing protein [Bacteroidales bacterium]